MRDSVLPPVEELEAFIAEVLSSAKMVPPRSVTIPGTPCRRDENVEGINLLSRSGKMPNEYVLQFVLAITHRGGRVVKSVRAFIMLMMLGGHEVDVGGRGP